MSNQYTSDNLIPLVVDLDGTLTPTDTLVESLAILVKTDPFSALYLIKSLICGRATLKKYVASKVIVQANYLPYNSRFLTYLRGEKEKGRMLVLATAAHHSTAKAVAAHLGIFDDIISTKQGKNLKGYAKLEAIKKNVGECFAYAGDCRADLPIWKFAEAAVLVGVSRALSARVQIETPIEMEFPREQTRFRDWLKALRPHQWTKNLLVFVPLLTSFSFYDSAKIIEGFSAFVAFSVAASAAYILNDIWDISSDRAHPRKCFRPFARAAIPIPYGVIAAFFLLTVSLMIATSMTKGFLIGLVTYIAVTCAYSWVLKTYVLIDLLTLSLLYTLRIFGGALAIEVAISPWLLAFSVFLFFSLAIVKRCSELVSLANYGQTATNGRDYRVADLTVLWPLGIGASLSAIVIFGLYINSIETQTRYGFPQLLWLVGTVLIYWVSRLWIKTSRGEMHDDPIIFAVKDFGSSISMFLMVALTLMAYFLHL